MRWLCSGALEDSQHDSVKEKHGIETLYSAAKSLMHVIRTPENEAQQDMTHWMIKILKHWSIVRWSGSTLKTGKPLLWIPKQNAHLVDRQWTEEEQATLKTVADSYTSQGPSGACRVHKWWQAYFSVALGDTEDQNDVSGQWYDKWPLDTCVDSPIFW